MFVAAEGFICAMPMDVVQIGGETFILLRILSPQGTQSPPSFLLLTEDFSPLLNNGPITKVFVRFPFLRPKIIAKFWGQNGKIFDHLPPLPLSIALSYMADKYICSLFEYFQMYELQS